MKHLIILVVVALAFTAGASAQSTKKTATKDKAKVEATTKTAAKDKAKTDVKAKTPAAVESLPAGAMLDLNISPKSDLVKLPGIGDAYADKIIKGRPYARKDELVSKKIITQKMYDAIKESIVARQGK